MTGAPPKNPSERPEAPSLERVLDESVPSERDVPVSEPASVEIEVVGELTGRHDRDSFLLETQGANAGRLHVLSKSEHVIGRAATADVRVDERAVSLHHAKLYQRHGRAWVVDLGSTNGTFLNGERITREVELRTGDLITIGETDLSFASHRPGGGERTIQLNHFDRRVRPLARQPSPGAWIAPADPEVKGRPEGEDASFEDLIRKVLDWYRVFRRYRYLCAALMVVGASAGVVATYMRPPRATASLSLRLSTDAKENPVERQGSNERNSVAFFRSVETNFLSPNLIKMTLAQLDGRAPEPDEIAATATRLAMESKALNVYHASYQEYDPARAMAFLTRHVDLYLQTEIDKTLKVIGTEVEFLSNQLRDNEAELTKIESDLKEFKNTNLGRLPEQASGYFSSRMTLKDERDTLDTKVKRLDMELALNKQRLKSENALFGTKVEAAKPYEAAISEQNRKISEAKAKGLAEEHPEMKQLRQHLAQLKELAAGVVNSSNTELERRSNPAYQQLRDRVADLEVEKQVAQKELGLVSGRLSQASDVLEDMPAVEAKYAEMMRTYEAANALHTKLTGRLKVSQLQFALERASAAARYELLSPVAAAPAPIKRTLALRALIGAAIGLIVAAISAVLRELTQYVKQVQTNVDSART